MNEITYCPHITSWNPGCPSCRIRIRIGLKSGEYGGKNNATAPRAVMESSTPFALCTEELSKMTMSPSERDGERKSSTYFLNSFPLSVPSKTIGKMPYSCYRTNADTHPFCDGFISLSVLFMKYYSFALPVCYRQHNIPSVTYYILCSTISQSAIPSDQSGYRRNIP